MSLESETFSYKLKIATVIPLYKAGDPAKISHYRLISVLPCFSKMLEQVMYNRLYKYLTREKIYILNSLVFKETIPQSTHLRN